MAAPVKVAKQQTAPELPNPASGTYTPGNPPEPSETVRNQPFGNFRNLPPKPTHTPEPCGTFRNLPPEPTPFYTGTLRNLHTPELSGTFLGTCSCNPHRYTPELIWAEDPISLRCWGTMDRVPRCGLSPGFLQPPDQPKICGMRLTDQMFESNATKIGTKISKVTIMDPGVVVVVVGRVSTFAASDHAIKLTFSDA